MSNSDIYAYLTELKIIPVVAIESVDDAIPLADALIAGGLPVAEITFRTHAAPDVMRLLRNERPDLLLGAGTVTRTDQVKSAKLCGAQFAVAPGVNPTVIREAAMEDLPFSPGVMTPSDIENALACDVHILKFFPAEAAGGLKMLKSLAGPYEHLGVQFIPTGGITLDNAKDYLGHPRVIAAGGTWIATKEDIATGNWDGIVEKCRTVKALIA